MVRFVLKIIKRYKDIFQNAREIQPNNEAFYPDCLK